MEITHYYMQAVKSIPKEKLSMFSKVVYKLADNKYKVEGTDEIGNKSKTTYYKSLDDMPDGLGDKVKQLMWTSKDDQSITENLGVRIGEAIFWII